MPAHAATTSGGSLYLEVAGDLVRDGAEELLAVGLGVGAADGAALRGVAVAEDGDDERLVRAPPCKASPRGDERTVRSRDRSSRPRTYGAEKRNRECHQAETRAEALTLECLAELLAVIGDGRDSGWDLERRHSR